MRSLVYSDKPQTLDHLEDNIRRVIADIRPQMLEKVIENRTSRLDYIRASRGSPMPEIIFKIFTAAVTQVTPSPHDHAGNEISSPRSPINEDEEEDENSRGQILLALLYSDEHNALVVNIVRCVRLPSRENNGFPDPFVKVQIKPDSMRRRFKTSMKKKTLNPEYNEQYAFEVEPGDMAKKTIEVTVWDKDYSKTDSYLGGLALNMQSKGDRLRHWLDVVRNPNRRIERWHPLRLFELMELCLILFKSLGSERQQIIVRVQYFVRGGFVGYRSRASSKHLSPHLPVDELDSSGGQTGVALHLQMHVWVSGPQRKPTRC
ncbi:double C2-like domain-containing protein beta [Trichonephila clavipes]|nr:double C2-like domain-containing protein beta [Trichonephila clavipes]